MPDEEEAMTPKTQSVCTCISEGSGKCKYPHPCRQCYNYHPGVSCYWHAQGKTPADKRIDGRTFPLSDGRLGCDECCNGDRCDDPTHHSRENCPYCLGSNIIEPVAEPASTLKELDPELYEKAANHVVELHEPASTGGPPRVARNWDEQCKVELVVDKVTWYCQWKVHDGDNHFFGNPEAARPSESSQASAEPIPLQPRCPNCSGLLNFTHNRTITFLSCNGKCKETFELHSAGDMVKFFDAPHSQGA